MLIAVSSLTGLEGLNLAARKESGISDRGAGALLNLVNLRLLGFFRPPSLSEEAYGRVKRMFKLKNLVPAGCAFLDKGQEPYYEASEPFL